MTEKDLRFGYWWVTHKVQVRHAAEIALGVVSAPLLAIGIFGYADWYFGSGVAERANLEQQAYEYIDYAALHAAAAPKPLQVDSPLVLDNGAGNFDVAVRMANPNRQWWPDFDYSFGAGTERRHAFLMPLDESWIATLGVKSESRPAPSAVTIENLHWNRVDPHGTPPDYETWRDIRIGGLTVSDAKFTAPTADDPVKVSRASFTLTNGSGYGWTSVPLSVVLLAGTRVVGVTNVTISALRAGEVRTADASWYGDLPNITKVEVKPELNIFSAQSYIKPGQ